MGKRAGSPHFLTSRCARLTTLCGIMLIIRIGDGISIRETLVMLKWIVMLGVCALLAGCGGEDELTMAEFEATARAAAPPDPCRRDRDCWEWTVEQSDRNRTDDYPDSDPDEEDWPYVK
jgi:hypothetical protein